jgi:hypothetical protein
VSNGDGWWDGDPSERYWLEITDRDDLGVDLHAPDSREGDDGTEYWSYAFVRQVREGDVVLHYRTRPYGQIVAWSRAVGEPYRDEVYWGAHGQAGGRGPVDPYWRPGWRLQLEGPFELSQAVPQERIRQLEPGIRAVHDELLSEHGKPLYFPFLLSDKRPLRAFQGYLTKFPRALLEAIPELAALDDLVVETASTPQAPAPAVASSVLGTDYRHVDPSKSSARREPFSVDPDRVDRGLAGHKATQEALWAQAVEAGVDPRSPRAGEPQFDIAWEEGDAITVAEVKSVTDRNEEKQLRLALGQVLRYKQLLEAKGRPVRAVIAAEREPSDPSWRDLCDTFQVALIWPAVFAEFLGHPGADG